MRPSLPTALVVCTVLLAGRVLGAEASAGAPAGPPIITNATPAPDGLAFKNEKDKLSYALGVNAASQLRRRAVEVDPDLYVQGFKTHLSGMETLLTAAQASAAVGAFQTQLASKEKGEKTHGSRERAGKNKKEEEAFLAENKGKEGVVTLDSGLQYRILRGGDGRKATLEDTIICNYRGTLIDGTEIDSTAKRDKPGVFSVKKVMKGWREALQLMPVGSKWEVVIPPNLAYGTRGAGRLIGPNATLIFELELLGIKDQPSPEQHVAATPAASDQKRD